MPGYKTHISGGIILALAALIIARASSAIAVYQIPELLAAALCGALFPDIDTKSMGRRMGIFIAGIGALILIVLGYLQLAIVGMLALCVLSFLPHRGPTHRFEFLIILIALTLGAVFLFFPRMIIRAVWSALFFSIGVFSHLVLDGRLVRVRKRRR